MKKILFACLLTACIVDEQHLGSTTGGPPAPPLGDTVRWATSEWRLADYGLCPSSRSAISATIQIAPSPISGCVPCATPMPMSSGL